MTEEEEEFEGPSKSQRKRDMQALKDLAQRLVELSSEQLEAIEDTRVRESVLAAKKITKGNARKRQLQYTAKLMSKIDVTPMQLIIDELDASSAVHIQKFHQLEVFRARLIEGDKNAMDEFLTLYPTTNRQQLRQLIRAAQQETEQHPEQKVQFRKLFKFLKAESEAG
ncbi:MAG: DUF615 domain-containing protein [Pseudomonadales bacterium]|nr:DUF615 domain-containing protein [Pseudomonadales bacterium]MBO6566021.1 DUF615 domain-containing protein [Pseudomonadales bacterium]MBO6594222.1 DUF615 domain-containing protein [Pseudomonadales bacterium]MBO6822217.1 DUF615 domain-containing protein [Pseudomonadales bacterium]